MWNPATISALTTGIVAVLGAVAALIHSITTRKSAAAAVTALSVRKADKP